MSNSVILLTAAQGKHFGPCNFCVAVPSVSDSDTYILMTLVMDNSFVTEDGFVCTGLLVRGTFENCCLKGTL